MEPPGSAPGPQRCQRRVVPQLTLAPDWHHAAGLHRAPSCTRALCHYQHLRGTDGHASWTCPSDLPVMSGALCLAELSRVLALPAGAAPAPPVRGTGVLAGRRREHDGGAGRLCPDRLPLARRALSSMSYSPRWSGWRGSHPRPLAPQASALLLRHSLMAPPPGSAPGSCRVGGGRSVCLSYGGSLVRMAGSAPAPTGWKPAALLATPHPDGRSCGLCPRGLLDGTEALWLSELNSVLALPAGTAPAPPG